MHTRIIKLLLLLVLLLNTYFAFGENESIIGRCNQINDPYQNFNRKSFAFNKTLDNTLLRPPILLYIKVIPKWPRNRIHSFFSNLSSPLTFINNIFQGDFENAGKTFGRFLFNSTAGLGGLIDWSNTCGVENRPQTFDNTMATYGMPYGDYIVIPFLGPSTTRGVIGKIIDTVSDPINLILNNKDRNLQVQLFLANKFDQRVQAEETLNLSQQNLLDEYSFIRSSYLQYIAAQNPLCKNNEEIEYELPE